MDCNTVKVIEMIVNGMVALGGFTLIAMLIYFGTR